MSAVSSNGTVPNGLSLYIFDYPPDHAPDRMEFDMMPPAECFLESDKEAARIAAGCGACRVVHAVSGRIVFQR